MYDTISSPIKVQLPNAKVHVLENYKLPRRLVKTLSIYMETLERANNRVR